MKRRFWIVYVVLLGASIAFGQAKASGKTPQLTQAEKDQLAKLVSHVMYDQADVRKYVTELEAEHPGYKVQMIAEGVFELAKAPPAPATPPPSSPAKPSPETK